MLSVAVICVIIGLPLSVLPLVHYRSGQLFIGRFGIHKYGGFEATSFCIDN